MDPEQVGRTLDGITDTIKDLSEGQAELVGLMKQQTRDVTAQRTFQKTQHEGFEQQLDSMQTMLAAPTKLVRTAGPYPSSRIPMARGADQGETELIDRMLGKIDLVGDDSFYSMPPGDASVSQSLTERSGNMVYTSADKLENFLMATQVAIKHLVNNEEEDKDQVRTWLDTLSVEKTRDAISDFRQRVMTAARHDSAVATLEKTQSPEDDLLTVQLGDAVLDGRTKKDFVNSLTNQQFSLTADDVNKPFYTYISNLASYITQYKLSSAGAYALACSCLKGTGLMFTNAQERSGISFVHYFPVLQTMGTRHCSPALIVEQIQKVRNSVPDDLCAVVARLHELNAQLYKSAPKEQRLQSIVNAFRSDFEFVIKQAYPHLHPVILQEEKNSMLASRVERDCLLKAGLPLTSLKNTWHPTNTLVAVALKHCRDAKMLGPVSDGAKYRKQGAVNAVFDLTSEPEVAPKGRLRAGQSETPSFAEVASMIAQNGSTRQHDFPRSNRGTFASRGGSRPRGNGQTATGGNYAPRAQHPQVQARSAQRGGRGRYPSSTRQNVQTVNAVSGQARAPAVFHCKNCGIPYHRHSECRKYPGQAPGQKQCPICSGFHVRACVSTKAVHSNTTGQSSGRQ